jgi:hypothetical protein
MVPKDRDGKFQTELFERYQSSEKAFVLALLQMYVEGASTRKVSAITEALCGLEVSKSQVPALTQKLDAEVADYRYSAKAHAERFGIAWRVDGQDCSRVVRFGDSQLKKEISVYAKAFRSSRAYCRNHPDRRLLTGAKSGPAVGTRPQR